MNHIEMVAKCATGPVVTETDIRDSLGYGFSSGMVRYYGLLGDHSAILPVRSVMDLERHVWAGFWKGATSVPVQVVDTER